MSADAVLDPGVVAELRLAEREYGNPTFIRQLVEMFRTNAPARVALMREAVRARDAAALGRTAHTLKSNAGMLGATGMAGLCARLEAYGDAAARDDAAALDRAAAFDEAAALLNEADAELGRVLNALAELVERQQSV
jgi:HPt (histidine-containing phosphotransfer) domain-containing protein